MLLQAEEAEAVQEEDFIFLKITRTVNTEEAAVERVVLPPALLQLTLLTTLLQLVVEEAVGRQ
jgi:hypothetical protein